MESVVLTNADNLIKEIGSREVYIYGAKVTAIKTYKKLFEENIKVRSFLVSEKYDNPDIFQGLPVLKIEQEKDRCFECVVVAMGTKTVWQMEEKLVQYNIQKLILLHPALMGKLCKSWILSSLCQISENAIIENGVDLVTDNTSSIEIGPYVHIESGTTIYALNHSHIKIGEYTDIHRDVMVRAENYSSIHMGCLVEIFAGGNYSNQTI